MLTVVIVNLPKQNNYGYMQPPSPPPTPKPTFECSLNRIEN